MAVAIRLSRGGSKKRPFYRIVAADVRSPRDGRFIERLGTYNPMKEKGDPNRLNLNKDRIKYWISVGAKPTERVSKFLFIEGIGGKPKFFEQTKKNKPSKKTLEKLKAKEEKLKAKKEAAASPAPETPPAPEAASAPETPPAPEAASTPETPPAPETASAPETPPAPETASTQEKKDNETKK